jgi:hypothetical protein
LQFTSYYGVPLLADIEVNTAVIGYVQLGYGVRLVVPGGQFDLNNLMLTAYLKPAAGVNMVLSARARLLILSAGVQGSLTMAELAAPVALGWSTNATKFAFDSSVDFTFLKGRVDFFYDIWWCRTWFTKCGGQYNKRKYFPIVNWSGDSKDTPLWTKPACTYSSGRVDPGIPHPEAPSNNFLHHFELEAASAGAVEALPFTIPSDALVYLSSSAASVEVDVDGDDEGVTFAQALTVNEALALYSLLTSSILWNPYWLPVFLVPQNDTFDVSHFEAFVVDCDPTKSVDFALGLPASCPSMYRALHLKIGPAPLNLDEEFMCAEVYSIAGSGMDDSVAVDDILGAYASLSDLLLNRSSSDTTGCPQGIVFDSIMPAEEPNDPSLSTTDTVLALWWLSRPLQAFPSFPLKCDEYSQVCHNYIRYLIGRRGLTRGNAASFVLYSVKYRPQCDDCVHHCRLSLYGLPTVSKPPKDRDEFPYNSITEGGCNARIEAIDPHQNRVHGGQLGGFYRDQRFRFSSSIDRGKTCDEDSAGCFNIYLPADYIIRNFPDNCTETDMRCEGYKDSGGMCRYRVAASACVGGTSVPTGYDCCKPI